MLQIRQIQRSVQRYPQSACPNLWTEYLEIRGWRGAWHALHGFCFYQSCSEHHRNKHFSGPLGWYPSPILSENSCSVEKGHLEFTEAWHSSLKQPWLRQGPCEQNPWLQQVESQGFLQLSYCESVKAAGHHGDRPLGSQRRGLTDWQLFAQGSCALWCAGCQFSGWMAHSQHLYLVKAAKGAYS